MFPLTQLRTAYRKSPRLLLAAIIAVLVLGFLWGYGTVGPYLFG